MKRLVVVVVFSVVIGVPVAAADIAGSWKVDGSIAQFPVDLVCSFKQADKALTGTCKGTDIGELSITGESDGPKATWQYDVNFQGQQFTIVYSATVDSATAMKGTITVMGMESGSFTAKKQ
jgi:hypothetical protein